MDFIEELKWRGMLHNITPDAEKALKEGNVVGYIGFDPTAPSMTIGNFVQLQLLRLFQDCGHTPIVLMGGATGRIGDPSGKDKERELKSAELLDTNLAFQQAQIRKFLNFEGENKAIIVNNFEFYNEMNVLDFLRDVGKTLTVSYMMSKDSVKNRLESGLSFTEFSYQLLQAYDFQCLLTKYNCVLQMGGSDQWGNITSGTEFVRRNVDGGKVHAITTPLLTKSDGKKFGKSEEGNIWLDPEMTSPYKFYQFWINADDADLPKYFRYFSLLSKLEIENLEETHKTDPNSLKRILAEELTIRVHSQEALDSVVEVSEILFNKKANKDFLFSLSNQSFLTIEQELSSHTLSKDLLNNGAIISDLLTLECSIFSSKGEARRAIKNRALSVNKTKVTSHEYLVSTSDLINETFVLIENGKKNKYLLTFN